MGKRSIKNQGFSLTEVLIALTVLGIITTVGFESLQVSHTLTRISADTNLVTMLAKNKMTEFHIHESKAGNFSGIFQEPYEDFSYRVEIRHVPKRHLYHIKMTISGRNQLFFTESYLLAKILPESE